MKKKVLLYGIFLSATSMGLNAANLDLPVGMEILTPDGVVLTTNTERSMDKDKDIVVAGSPEKGYKVFFTAKEDQHGEELWVSDGTKEGTFMVKDIYPGSYSSDVCYLCRFNDKVVFQATGNDEDGAELWISDGTEAGTHMIMDINPIDGSYPHGFCQLDENRFIFGAIDLESMVYGDEPQHWLWISDGTEDGTMLLKDCQVIYPGHHRGNDHRHFVRMGRKVFFKADTKDNEYTENIWITDGTEEGTIMLGDINTEIVDEATGQTGNADIDWITPIDNQKIIFAAYDVECGWEPWVSDGTVAGTNRIIDATPGFDNNGRGAGDGMFTTVAYDGYVYYRGKDPSGYAGIELMRTDGTLEGTRLVGDTNLVPNDSGTNNGTPDLFCVYEGTIFMKSQSGVNAAYDFCKGLELFYYDPVKDELVFQSDLNPGTGPNAAWEGTVVSGSMFFRAQDATPAGDQTWELFRIDNKDQFPVKVMDLAEGQDFVHSLRNCDGDLFFTSKVVPSLFRYHYRKEGYDVTLHKDEMEPVYDSNPSSAFDTKVFASEVHVSATKGMINFTSTDELTGCVVYDMLGRLVKRCSLRGNNASVIAPASGIYTIKVTTEAGISITKVAVK